MKIRKVTGSKVNEDEGLISDYHQRLFAFLDQSWQEDSEIELVRLIGAYKDQFKVNKPEPIQDYLKRLVELNGVMGSQGFSDEFMNQLQDLLGTNPSESGEEDLDAHHIEDTEGAADESKKSGADMKRNESKKVNEIRDDSDPVEGGERDRFEEIMGEIEELADQARQIIQGKFGGQSMIYKRATSYWFPWITSNVRGGGSMTTMEDTLGEWDESASKGDDEDPGDEDGFEEGDEGLEGEPPRESKSIRTARKLLGLKERAEEDKPVKVGDLVQIVNSQTYQVEVEEATVKALDEKKGVEITGSMVPVSQKWYAAPYWFVSVLESKKVD